MSSPIPVVGPLGKMSRRFASVTLFSQAFAVFFGALTARALAHAAGDERSTWYLVAGSALAAACLLGMVVLRRPWGVTVGWVLQALTVASALVEPAMLVVALIFLGLWIAALYWGHRMDELTRQFEARHPQGGPAQGGVDDTDGRTT